jgi:hypothetical protein
MGFDSEEFLDMIDDEDLKERLSRGKCGFPGQRGLWSHGLDPRGQEMYRGKHAVPHRARRECYSSVHTR